MNIKRLLFVVAPLILLCWSPIINAAESEKLLTLDKAIDIALQYNITLRQSTNQLGTSKITMEQKKANFLPEFSVSAGTTERFAKDYDSTTGKYSGTTSNSISASATATYNLFNGFSDRASLQQARLDFKSSGFDVTRTRQSIIFQTIQQFIQVVTTREFISVEKENLEAQRLLLKRIEDYYKSGKRPVTDFYQQQAQISSAELQLLNAQRNYEVNKLLLMQILGWDSGTDFEVIDPGIDQLLTRVLNYKKENILDEAMKTRADILSQELQVEAANQGIIIAKSGYYPKLSLSGDLSSSYSKQSSLFNFPDQFFKNNLGGSIRLSLSVPVFDKFRTKYSVANANIALKNQKLELEKKQLQVHVELKQALQDFQTAVKQMDVAENQLTYSKQALDSIQERYDVNASTMIELTQSRALYLQAVYDRIQARFNVLIRGISISYYKGDGDEMINLLAK